MYFEYDEKALHYLRARDAKLGVYIDKFGKIYRKVEPDVFISLVQSMLAQQISNKAYLTVNERVLNKCGGKLMPDAILALSFDDLRSCGLSARKTQNIFAMAEYFGKEGINAEYFAKKSDEEIIAELTRLPGVGVWTAEMFLLFSLQRQDILSYGDYGIKKGLCIVHGCDKTDKKNFLKFKSLYSPYGSIASLYLWETANTFREQE